MEGRSKECLSDYLPPYQNLYRFFSALVSISIDAGITYNVDRAIFLGVDTSVVPNIVSFGGLCNLASKIVVGKLTDLFRNSIN